MRAADMIPAAYNNGRYLRRWSLIGGYPRCNLPALVLADAGPVEVAATEAENARLHALVSAAEAYEAAVAAGHEPPPADYATLALAALRAGEALGEPMVLALVDPNGLVVNVVAVDADWQPTAPLVAVPAGEGAQAGGTYADGVFAPPKPVWSLEDYQTAVANHVEEVAQARQYSSAASCAGYANSTVPGWAAEAQAFIAWRDAVYLAVYAKLAEVQAGAPPPTVNGLLAALPVIQWPPAA